MPNTVNLVEAGMQDPHVEGILAALRYLSREAEDAGLTELARTLEEAGLKCDRETLAARAVRGARY
jgi:hypothetical protein